MKANHPPKTALRILSWFCPDYLYEEIEGDLIQHFHRDLKKFSESRSRRRFYWNMIRFFRPGILLRNKPSTRLNSLDMLSNYFKIAFRVILRNKSYSFINLFSLALGITAFAFLFLWVQNEFSYDQFHPDKERIYKAWNKTSANGQINSWDVTARVLAPTLKEEYTSVESAVSYAAHGEEHLFTEGDKRLLKNTGVYADGEILTMFNFPLIKGNAATAFKNPQSIAITENFAHELFGDKEALGETVTIGEPGESFSLTVTAVLKDLPSNTDFHFEYIIPYSLIEMISGRKETRWGINSMSTYVKLKEGTNVDRFNEEIKDIVKKHYKDAGTQEVFLYPITKMRLYSRFENGVPAGGRIEIVRLLGILGICLLTIACINFINLSTARAQRRSKEVAVRKVTGAFRNSLVAQFLSESILLALGAGLLSFMAVYTGLPFFSRLIGADLSLELTNLNFWLGGLLLIVFVGLLAGSYPAFYLSAFKPVKILKGTLSHSGKSRLRSVLVVFQFGLAITLMVSVFVVQRQIQYLQNRDAGYEKENLVYQYFTGTLGKNYEAYKRDLLQLGVAESITKTSTTITSRWSNTDGIEWNGKDPQNKTMFERIYVDDHFATTAGLTVIRGRDMDLEKFSSDSTAVVLNEAAAKAIGFNDPLGEIIKDNGIEWHIVGVVKDFILSSPSRPVEPIILFGAAQSWAFSVTHIKLSNSKPTQENIRIMSDLSKKYNPDYPFVYEFVDVAYARKFVNLEATRTITVLASVLTFIIAGLGLLGLSTYMVEVRVKEIGIRKVMGGSILSITRMLTWASIKPILVAVLIFGPQAWFAMNWWLSSYPYRINVGIFTIPLAALAVILLAVMITSTQTIRAAKANPVNSLRNE